MKPKRIPRKVLAEAVKKAGTFHEDYIILELCPKIAPTIMKLSNYADGPLEERIPSVRDFRFESGFHYSPHKTCKELTLENFVECWSGDVDNPTVTRHKVGNCKVKV